MESVTGSKRERLSVGSSAEAAPRLRKPDRHQAVFQPCVLDELLAEDHPARAIWAVVERLDLSRFEAVIKARGSEPGRAATDPRLLAALWLYAYTEGVGSGRELERLCGCQDAYRWLCGGITVNHHTLNDFRVDHGEALDELFTQVVMRLVHAGVVDVRRISQDGTRVRASAGGGSFRSPATLDALRIQAKAHLEALVKQTDPAWSARQAAAQHRAAHERLERIEEALAQVPELEAAKQRYGNRKRDAASKAKPVRSSTTDAGARKMKMGDGGYRPAYNVQLAGACGSRAIVAVAVTNQGSDQHQSVPLRDQTECRTGRKVHEHLLDGGFVHRESIERAGEQAVAIYAPVQQIKGTDPTAPKKGDGPHVRAWRQRMARPEAQAIYKERAAISETINADLKTWRGLDRLPVRGIAKVTCIALWSALAYNLMHFSPALLLH